MTDATTARPGGSETFDPQTIARAVAEWKHARSAGSRGAVSTPARQVVLTDEQIAVVRAATSGAALVTAGAGSGKTETMTLRILWLVANGHARLDEILGMTFTRRAATSLAQRVNDGIDALRHAKILPQEDASTEALFSSSITTYNAFANRVFGDFAHLIGEDGSAAVMTEATAFNLARDVVLAAPREVFDNLDAALNDIVEGVLSISRSLTDNMVDPAHLREFAHTFRSTVEPLPLSLEKTTKRKNRDCYDRGLAAVAELDAFADLATRYARAKRDRHLIEFSDQIAYAHRLSDLAPVRQAMGSRYRYVLLDEYQDTSSVQVAFLARMFADVSVMAVGDPNQAIYAWRGASASNMRPERFFEAFGRSSGNAEYWLSTSWRNPRGVLDCANALIEPLTTARPDGSSFALRPGVTHEGAVTVAYCETIADEANAVADWFYTHLAEWTEEHPPTAAVLARKNADLLHMKMALEKRGLRTHVLGLGGLLMEPVIIDIVCTLRVIHLANSDSELIRLLAGARWQIAPRDLRSLKRTAEWLGKRDYALTKLSGEVAERLRESVSAADGYSLVDALDYLASTDDPHPEAIEHLSPVALDRLRDAGRLFARLRRHAGIDLRELVRLIIAELMLDVELVANDTVSSRYATATVQSFLDTVASFVTTSDHPSLGALVVWLEEVERRERLSTAQEDPEPGVIQLLTIHGAKGLEWDLVAVTRMSAPAAGQAKAQVERWTNRGVLPEQLRADRNDLGVLWEFARANDQIELEKLFEVYFDSAMSRHLESERRLTYVGLTRAARHLLLSGSWWATGKTVRLPSEYLQELSSRGLVQPELPTASEFDANPWDPRSERVQWPLSPLGSRHNRVTLAAAAVRNALASEVVAAKADPRASRLGEDIELLLAERDERAMARTPRLPQRIPASQFKDFVVAHETRGAGKLAADSRPGSPESSLTRPLPEQPYRATMLGTLFHAWVESRYLPAEAPTLFDLAEQSDRDSYDVTAFDVIDGSDPRRLEDLKKTFENSPWAARQPIAVESEIHLPLGPNIIVCKLDAVYAEGEGDTRRYEIVDWKTGRPPETPADIEARMYQLALYRAAFAALEGVPETQIDACLYYVAHDHILRPEKLPSRADLEQLWMGVYES